MSSTMYKDQINNVYGD